MAISPLYPDFRPLRGYNFAKVNFVPPELGFARASTGTYIDANGLIRTALPNEPRFDHDPVTGENKGLLVEVSRTNLLTYSKNFFSNWALTGASLIPNDALAPDGTFTANRLTGTNIVESHFIGQDIAMGASPYTFSCFIKAGSTSTASLFLTQSGNNGGFYDLSTGTVLNVTGTGNTASIQNAGNGWWRCIITNNGSADLFNSVRICINDTAYTAKAAPGSIYIWGAQVEAGTFPTSYIPTPATFTSRASTATYYDANGVIQTAGTDVARDNAYFPDENGVMRPAGLLLEAARTNLCTQSETFTGSPFTLEGATASKTQVAPDGSTNATLITLTAGDTVHHVRENISTNRVTRSFFVKKSNCRYVYILDNNGGYYGPSYKIDLDTGSITLIRNSDNNTYPNYGFGISEFPSGYYRVWFDAIQVNIWAMYPSNINYLVGQSIPVTFNADGTEQFIIWGYQVETSSRYSTSYIPTSGTTVTRAADISTSSTVTRVTDTLSPITLPTSNSSTIIIETESRINNNPILSLNDSTTTNELLFSLVTPVGGNLPTRSTTAFSLDGEEFRVVTDGLPSGTSTTSLTGLNNLKIGGNAAGTSIFDGTIKSLYVYDSPLEEVFTKSLTIRA